jgi:hypothetical protein
VETQRTAVTPLRSTTVGILVIHDNFLLLSNTDVGNA